MGNMGEKEHRAHYVKVHGGSRNGQTLFSAQSFDNWGIPSPCETWRSQVFKLHLSKL